MIQFNSSQFKTHYCRIITGYIFYIASARFILPSKTICGIILMTEHYSFIQNLLQVMIKIYSFFCCILITRNITHNMILSKRSKTAAERKQQEQCYVLKVFHYD